MTLPDRRASRFSQLYLKRRGPRRDDLRMRRRLHASQSYDDYEEIIGEVRSGSWLFCGSDRGGERAAIMCTLIGTARLSDVDLQAWIADVPARINDQKVDDLAALLPWYWRLEPERRKLAA
jgi:IS66 C-terminal element